MINTHPKLKTFMVLPATPDMGMEYISVSRKGLLVASVTLSDEYGNDRREVCYPRLEPGPNHKSIAGWTTIRSHMCEIDNRYIVRGYPDRNCVHVNSIDTGELLYTISRDNTPPEARYGDSVAVHDGMLLVGAPGFTYDDPKLQTGRVMIYRISDLEDFIEKEKMSR